LKFIFTPLPLNHQAGYHAIVVDLVTGQTQRLELTYHYDLHWSPDGKFLFYGKINEDNVVALTIYDLTQKTSRLLLEIPLNFATDKFLSVGWSPDSRQVAFIAKLEGQYDLYTLEVETLALRQLTFSPEAEVLAAWSPVANQLVVLTSANERILSLPFFAEKLQLIDDSGVELAFLGPFEALTNASWSPEGQQIAYSGDEGLCILDVATLDSTCPFEDTILAEYVTAPDLPAAWSSDGKWLAFQSYGETLCYWLFLFDLSTNTVVDPEGPCSTRSYIHWSRAMP
jgi:Tol biopolymer transport system component